jgi:hypothetical protein
VTLDQPIVADRRMPNPFHPSDGFDKYFSDSIRARGRKFSKVELGGLPGVKKDTIGGRRPRRQSLSPASISRGQKDGSLNSKQGDKNGPAVAHDFSDAGRSIAKLAHVPGTGGTALKPMPNKEEPWPEPS